MTPQQPRTGQVLSIEDRELLRVIYRGSFEGVVHHPRLVPLILSDANVRKVTEACRFFSELKPA